MTRTSDEIKKGLEHAAIDCRDAHDCDKTCAYYKECTNFDYEITEVPCTMLFDALTLIQQLQDENAQLNRCIENMTDKLNAMNDEVAKLQAERDAAVADLEHVKDCDSCKYDDACFTGKKDCFGCHEKRCPCLTCQYEWRGVTKEE